MSKYIEIKLLRTLPKTKVYQVINKKDQEVIGEIQWFGRWRKYCFFPRWRTVWSSDCLFAIESFMDQLMEERKNEQA